MKTQLVARGRALASPTRRRIERRLHFELSRFADCIQKVAVRLADDNDPRSGLRTSCLVAVYVKPLGQIVARAQATGDAEAAALAIGRAGRSLGRRLDWVEKGSGGAHR